MIIFSRDERKSDANFRLRGFDFALATRIFAGWTVEHQDSRREYAEIRIVAVGQVDGTYLTVVYTDRRNEGRIERRIISA